METSHSDDDYQNAMLFCTNYRVLQALLNPGWSQDAAANVFAHNTDTNELLENFDINREVYGTIGPDIRVCSESMQNLIEIELHRSVHVALEVHIAIPKMLKYVATPTGVRIAIRFHGGGGMTGHPRFSPWECRADLEYILQAFNTISVDPTYCLMPEASSATIIGSVQSLCTFLFTKMESALQRINPNFFIDWSHVYIFGMSFGGWMALLLYLEFGRCTAKPADLRIRALVLRCPLTQEYRREAGNFMNIAVSKDQAVEQCKEVLQEIRNMPFVLHRAGSYPPEGMFGAYMFSVAHRYGEVWNGPTVYEMIENSKNCPDPRTRVRIEHGTEDLNVPYSQSVELCALLVRSGWPRAELVLHQGKPHAWDYHEPLTKAMREFLDGS